jgi:hypothetical protein
MDQNRFNSLVAILDGQPEILAVQTATLFMRGVVADYAVCEPSSVDLIVRPREMVWLPSDLPFNFEQDFHVWCGELCLTASLTEHATLLVMNGSSAIVRARWMADDEWHRNRTNVRVLVNIPLRYAVSVEIGGGESRSRFSTSVGDIARFTNGGRRYDCELHHAVTFAEGSLERCTLPRLVHFEQDDVIYNLGGGMYVLLREDRVAFFSTEPRV